MSFPKLDEASEWLDWYQTEFGPDHVMSKKARHLQCAIADFLAAHHRHPETHIRWRMYEVACACGGMVQPFKRESGMLVCGKCEGIPEMTEKQAKRFMETFGQWDWKTQEDELA